MALGRSRPAKIEKATGFKINCRQFGGGGDVIRAMASGDVQLGEVGSTGIATAISRGWTSSCSGSSRTSAPPKRSSRATAAASTAIADLKGKKIATPFVSTSHFQLLYALEQGGHQAEAMRRSSTCVRRKSRAAWERGDIDATFIWDPVLAEVKKDGKVLMTSGKLSAETGKATFDGYVVNKDLAKENPEFMVAFVKVLAAADARYRDNKAKWTADSPEVKAVAKWSGAKAEDVPAGDGAVPLPDARGAEQQVAGRRQEQRRGEGARGNREVRAVAKADREDAARLLGSGHRPVREGCDEVAPVRRGTVPGSGRR